MTVIHEKLKISLPPFFQFSESRMKTDDNPAGMEKMPVLFIGHGSPMNIVLKNRFTRSLADLGASLPRPAAIMVISAHWLTRGSFVTCIDRPRMIYDFYGFPEELYRVKYGCTGAPLLAKYVTEALERGYPVRPCMGDRPRLLLGPHAHVSFGRYPGLRDEFGLHGQ